ncbi:MAG: hypothetical protein J6V13_00240 [Paludibacteraceae bacterium]|nr:hypothetical protein [Paludibacteraceae bacterium]
MKKTLITLSLLIGLILATQAQLNIGLPPTLTYDNTPDSIKASLFSTNDTAMPFDSLYITVGTPWTETVNFYHSSRGADISTGLNASYVFTGTPTTANAVGKRPKADGTRGPKCNFNDLNNFETTNDGFLRDNKRTETTTLYYGWHKIQATTTYTCSHTQTQNLSRKRKWLFVYYWDDYKVSSTTDNGYKSSQTTTTYSYVESIYTNTGEASYENIEKPNNSNNTLPNNWQELVDNESWNPEPLTTPNESHFTGDADTATYSSTKSKSFYTTNYIYIWATKEEIESGTFTLPATNAEIEALINRSTTNSTGYTFNVTQNATLYDIVGQVRHHFTVGTPNSATYGTCHYNYYDTTWYNLAYSYNGQRYNTSNPNASYHEYDTNYEKTGEVTKIVNGESKSEYYSTIINKKPAVAMLVYAKQGNEFQYVRTANPRNQRAGRITDKKIYIRAYVDDLFWNSGDQLGWMQPVYCDIYLDNVRLRTANDTTTHKLFIQKMQLDYNGSLPSINLSTHNDIHSSVFFLPEGNTTIHTKGKNYLAGNIGKRLQVKLTVEINAFSVAALVTRVVETYIPNYSSPIEIKGAYLFDNNEQPNITCTFDSQWADGSNSNGYLDLSTRTCQHSDSVKLKANDYTITASRIEAAVFWTTHKGYRYASPLNTGGPNGSFIIDGGHINFWPANGHAANVELHSYGTKDVPLLGTMEITFSIIGGKYANYLVCGNRQWDLHCNGSTFDRSGTSRIYATDGTELKKTTVPLDIDIIKLMNDNPSNATLYGIGNGVPEGHLIINGGTISANTDPNSFAYKWTDYVGGKSVVKTAENVADDESGQPLFGPNVEIIGGTFLHPLYGTTDHGTGSALHKASYNRDGLNPISQWNNNGILDYVETDFKAKNNKGDAVFRHAYALPEVNTDYTTYNEINITDEPEAHNPLAEEGKKAVMGNAGTDKEYLYGMTNVRSDDKALGYFYLPEERSGIMQNYYIKSTNKLTAFTQTTQGEIASTHFPYHLWIDKGGEISVDDNYIIHGRPHYRATYTEDTYQTIAMPFTAKRFFVTDPWDDQFQFYSYVEVDDANAAGVPEADRIAINNNAYCYLYFLDDEATNSAEDADIVHDQRATGVNNTFRSYYHTHTDGSTMQAGKTYVIKFPKVDDANYWGTNIVTLQGEKGQTILGNNNFKLATRPETTPNDTENPTFIMDGNTTFATQNISEEGEIYLVDPTQWGDDAFHATTVSSLAPMQGYLVGSTTTMQLYRIIGREGKVEQTALDQLIHTGWTAVGAHQAMLIMTPQDATAHIYTAEGKLWKTVSLTANTGVIIDAPAGFYIVHAGNDSKKVLVH